jgi:hypothetical protein
MRFGTWNIRSLYRVGAIKSIVGGLEKCKLDLVGVQEVRWEGEGYQTADNYAFFYGKGNVKSSISDRMLYITLKGHWCVIILLDVHVPMEVPYENFAMRFQCKGREGGYF